MVLRPIDLADGYVPHAFVSIHPFLELHSPRLTRLLGRHVLDVGF